MFSLLLKDLNFSLLSLVNIPNQSFLIAVTFVMGEINNDIFEVGSVHDDSESEERVG